MTQLPLEHIRVLDLTRIRAGPTCRAVVSRSVPWADRPGAPPPCRHAFENRPDPGGRPPPSNSSRPRPIGIQPRVRCAEKYNKIRTLSVSRRG